MDNKQRILIDLDALVDTRLGAISQVSEAAAKHILFETEYANRKSDDFEKFSNGLITNDAYKTQYSKRDLSTLKVSIMTALPFVLNRMFKELIEMRENTPLVGELEVGINFWPYILSEEIKDDYLNAVSAYVGTEYFVKTTKHYYPPETITPAVLKSRWEAYITYEYGKWISLHAEALTHERIPRNTLMVPAISTLGEYDLENCKLEGRKEPVDPFAALELLMTEFLSVEVIQAKFFSVLKLA